MRKDLCLALILAMIMSLVCFTVSCSKTAVQSESAQVGTPEVQKASDKSADEAQQGGQMRAEQAQAGQADHESAEAAFVNDHIHFAFDSALLSAQAQQILNTKAQYMRVHPEINVLIEGYCDDRGTDAYNMALGARRADSVKHYLVTSGITADRLNTRSYGEERPIDPGRNEAAWAKNRRAQFVAD
jgi:peptidoglycan-associated lipoprotein